MTFPREDQNCEGFVQGHDAGGRQNKMIIYNSLYSWEAAGVFKGS